jgi:nucleotide-binding universal stress UspA family protein
MDYVDMEPNKTVKILIPTDFRVQSEYAYYLTRNLFDGISHEIHFVHVLEVPDTVYEDANGNIQTCGEIDPGFVIRQKEMALKKLDELSKNFQNTKTHLILGKVTDGILRYVSENIMDVLAMGTKGAFGIKEAISGSETQMIVRKSEIPVITLKCDRSDLKLRNTLFIHDFSKVSKEDLWLLKLLTEKSKAAIHFLHISKKEDNVESIRQNMKMFAELNGISLFQPHILSGDDIEKSVIDYDFKYNPDLVFIGTHGKGGIWHSSVTEKLVNHLFKPIVSFRLKN